MKLVDTSAWVEFLRQRGDPSVKHTVARLIEADRAAMTCPIRFELLSGVRSEEETDLLRTFEFSCHVPFERTDWQTAAQLERRLRAQGRTIPRNDLFVATVALRAGLTVVCRDAHFDSMQEALGEDLKVEQL
jgi:predicted nucleic acid-binding protein